MEGIHRELLAEATWNGDQVAPLFGYLGAAAALVFSCERWPRPCHRRLTTVSIEALQRLGELRELWGAAIGAVCRRRWLPSCWGRPGRAGFGGAARPRLLPPDS
jgi:hypothetical protein